MNQFPVWCVWAIVGAACGVPSLAHAESLNPAEWLTPKQIAAPPEDILSGMLRLPDPADLGRVSASAMLPVELAAGADGRLVWERVVQIGSEQDIRVMLLGPDAESMTLDVLPPQGPALALNAVSAPVGVTRTSDEKGVHYVIRGKLAGAWAFTITSVARAAGVEPHHLLISDSAPYTAYTHLNSLDLTVGNRISLVTQLREAPTEGERAGAPALIPGAVARAAMHVRLPNGEERVVTMTDDGAGQDARRGDSRFTGSLPAEMSGDYLVRVVVDGTAPNGRRVLRTSQHLVVVSPQGAELGATASAAELQDDALRVDIPVRGVNWTDRLKVSTEVWGRAADGNMVPVCWLGGIVGNDPAAQTITGSLRLDKRWIARAQASPPFELRHTRVQDLDTHVPLVRRGTMPLVIEKLDLRDIPANAPIDGVMRHGRIDQTERLLNRVHTPAAGGARAFGAHNLMLIHGYCSQFPLWPAGDFDGFLEFFQDPGQNRSHDEFAQLLAAHGSQSKSFGVVAHSQGGAAALHLSTYYWSGLDWATGPRLIQSLGTPYQGTPLATDIAFLGEIFGSGCGTNFDLTPEGSALWLAGIPSASRAEVSYWTTSFEDGFGFDFCNFVTDFLLNDPDDGVVERERGQLPGAVNMGHTEGQCHTTGMRDPAQYSDVSRNIEMNTNAAR